VLGAEVDDQIANRLCGQLLLLSAEDPRGVISLYINSPGGSVTAGLAIYDTIQMIKPDVATYCIGMSASMAAVLLADAVRCCTEGVLRLPGCGVDGRTADPADHYRNGHRDQRLTGIPAATAPLFCVFGRHHTPVQGRHVRWL